MIGVLTAVAAGTIYSFAVGGVAGAAGIGIGVLGSKIVNDKKHPDLKEANKLAHVAKKAERKSKIEAKKAERKSKIEAKKTERKNKSSDDKKIIVEAEIVDSCSDEEKEEVINDEIKQVNPLNLNIDPNTGTPIDK